MLKTQFAQLMFDRSYKFLQTFYNQKNSLGARTVWNIWEILENKQTMKYRSIMKKHIYIITNWLIFSTRIWNWYSKRLERKSNFLFLLWHTQWLLVRSSILSTTMARQSLAQEMFLELILLQSWSFNNISNWFKTA